MGADCNIRGGLTITITSRYRAGMAKLNTEHIAAINAAMQAEQGDVEKAAAVLRGEGWNGWDRTKLFDAIRNNATLRTRWGISKLPADNVVAPLMEEMTDIHRPELPVAPGDGELPDSINDGLTLGSLEMHEEEFRKQLGKLGEDQTTVEFMVAAGNLQSKFALCTLNSVTGGLVKSYNELRRAQQETMADLSELLNISDPELKILSTEREKILRDFFIQLHNCQLAAFDRINKAFYLQLEARKLEKGKNGRPKKMLGITAMPGSRVAVSMGNDGNGTG